MQILRLHIDKPAIDIPIHIGANLWESLREFLQLHFAGYSIFVITDGNISQLYSNRLHSKLRGVSGFKDIFTFLAGERNKNRQEKERLEDQLLQNKAGRDTVLLAIGGGVCGDLAGYVAATLYRGIPLIHVPTSLLAQVDSSIGGKVGINHPAGKNLIGAFHQPQAVFVDLEFLETLPEEEFLNGMAEVIKYAITLDDDLWHLIESESSRILNCEHAILEKLISRCIQLKVSVVAQDEKESGYRSVLNFGHTVGHAIEKLSGYKIKHGFAISTGMKMAVRLSQKLLEFPKEKVERLEMTLKSYQVDSISLREFPVSQIWEAMLSDKKTRQQSPRFTLLNRSCQPELFYPVQQKDFEDVYNRA
jgi:3-dehydroquinate synthase